MTDDPIRSPLVKERFDAKWMLCEETGCWIWMASRKPKGYGSFYGKVGSTDQAHRWAWMLYRGPIPDGMMIDHICRVHACVNPDHLRVVTARQNTIENSLSFMAVNARKTHCIHGHSLEGLGRGHYLRRSKGLVFRRCRQCYLIQRREARGRS